MELKHVGEYYTIVVFFSYDSIYDVLCCRPDIDFTFVNLFKNIFKLTFILFCYSEVSCFVNKWLK